MILPSTNGTEKYYMTTQSFHPLEPYLNIDLLIHHGPLQYYLSNKMVWFEAHHEKGTIEYRLSVSFIPDYIHRENKQYIIFEIKIFWYRNW
jgi:hypothetical protein